jgi:hypothetical protein
MIVDDFYLVGIARSKNKTDTKLIVYPNTPLAITTAFELFQAIARRNSQKCDFGGSVNHQQLSSCSPCNTWRNNRVSPSLEQFAALIASPRFDRHTE